MTEQPHYTRDERYRNTLAGRELTLRLAMKLQCPPTPDMIDTCSRLANVERQHHRLSEQLCNGIRLYDPVRHSWDTGDQDVPATERAERKQRNLEGQAVRLANLLPAAVHDVTFNHDPRGRSITLHTHNGELIV